MTADERIARLEKWLSELYGTAEKDMRVKWQAYLYEHKNAVDKLLEKIRNAKDDELKKKATKNYNEYMKDHVVTTKYFRGMVSELAGQYADAGRRASEIVNGERFEAFADGYNFSAGELNRAAVSQEIGIRFDLCDAWTIEHLAEHAEDLMLPPRAHPELLDMTVWNVHNINAQVTQGIVQGESIPKIAARLGNVTRMNEVAAVRTARTMATGCENAGRVQSMKAADKWGVKTRKQWLCTHDARTRHSHLELDGETVDDDAEFSNKCRYPGDPSGPPEEVYNCRCTLKTVIDGFSSNLPKGNEEKVVVTVGGERLERGRTYLKPNETDTEKEHRNAVRRLLDKAKNSIKKALQIEPAELKDYSSAKRKKRKTGRKK